MHRGTDMENAATAHPHDGSTRPAPRPTFIRRYGPPLWIVAFALLLALFLVRQRGEFSRFWTELRAARLSWLLVAIAIELVIVGLMAFKNQLLLRRLGYRVGLVPLLEIHLQRQVIGTVVPFGGPASTVAFV